MKKVSIIITVLMLFIVSSLSAAVSQMATAKVVVEADRIIVPLELENTQEMAALDLPLKFSEGVILEAVEFDGTRAEKFDFKAAVIDNQNNTVIIGLIPMVYGSNVDLAPGQGEIARLVFTIDDPTLQVLEITSTVIEEPEHTPMFVYAEGERGNSELRSADPGFEAVSIVLAEIPDGSTESNLPTEFALGQNYPNPFNPNTDIAYSVPVASHVKLEVLNVLGQRVITLKDEFSKAGSYVITWDGRDKSGRSVASGVYFYRMSTGSNFEEVKKMMMLK